MSEYVVVKRELLALLRQYVAEADPYGDAPMLLQDIDTALAVSEARPEPVAHEFRHRPSGKRRVVFSNDPQPAVTSEWTYERPLFDAPQGDAQ